MAKFYRDESRLAPDDKRSIDFDAVGEDKDKAAASKEKHGRGDDYAREGKRGAGMRGAASSEIDPAGRRERHI